MIKWQYTLALKDLWKAHEKEEITIHALSKEVARRIELLTPTVARRFEDEAHTLENDIQPLFEEVAELVDEMDVNDFDNALRDLYDWADTSLGSGRKLCWIETF